MFFCRFIECFSDFHRSAETEISLVETSLGIMLEKYKLISEMFTFELEKYSQEDFFRDFNEFIALYRVSIFLCWTLYGMITMVTWKSSGEKILSGKLNEVLQGYRIAWWYVRV